MSPNDRIFAFAIGIDDYASRGVPNLSGCVTDVEKICKFLTEILHVPNDNIVKLCNSKATASLIEKQFKFYATATSIPKDAIIFIYYAGHGGEALPPKHSQFPDQKVQFLLPHDFDRSSESDGVVKNALSDVKIGHFLQEIADEKGNNITVVFDSCHSASGTRDANVTDVGFATRGLDLREGTRLDIDAMPASGRGTSVFARDRNKGLASHVLLAACNEQQRAREASGKGVFTDALVTQLRLKSDKLTQLTYSDIIRSIPPLSSQNPQCEGLNKDHIFLYNHAAHSRHTLRTMMKDSKCFVIDVGAAHGVAPNAKFAVYNVEEPTKKIGSLIARFPEPLRSTLDFARGKPFAIPDNGAFVVQTGVGAIEHVRLFVGDLAHVFTPMRKTMIEDSPLKPSFKVIATPKKNSDLIATPDTYPDLIVDVLGNGDVHFTITDKICRAAGLNKIPYHPKVRDVDIMVKVLRGITDFYWNLRRTTTGEHLISPKIMFACYELKPPEFGSQDIEVVGNNLCVGGIIQIDIPDGETPYGFHIKNTLNVPLFVSVFYFDMSNLSIEPYYQPSAAGDKGHYPSIQPYGSLTIGYGSGGYPPRCFSVPEGQEVDVGYVKVFLSTEHVDYMDVPQESPFLPSARGSSRYTSNLTHRIWDTMLVPIVMRRKV